MESSPSPRTSSASSRRFRTFRLRPWSNSTFRFRDASARHRPEQYSAALVLSKCRWQLRQTLRTILCSQSPVRALARPQKGGIQPLDDPLSGGAILLLFALAHKPFGRLQNLDWTLGHQLASFEGKLRRSPKQHSRLRRKKGGARGCHGKTAGRLAHHAASPWSSPARIPATPSVRPTNPFNSPIYSSTLRSVEPPSSSGFSGVTSMILDPDSPSGSSALPSSTI